MRIVIEDDVDRNIITLKVTGKASDTGLMDAMMGSITRYCKKNGRIEDDPNQLKIEVEETEKSGRRNKR